MRCNNWPVWCHKIAYCISKKQNDVFLKQKLWLKNFCCRFYSMPPEESEMLGVLNPMCEAFPRVAQCVFYRYGTGGRQNCNCFQVKDSTIRSIGNIIAFLAMEALCILSLNILVDKIYLVLWFWYVAIGILGTIRVICRLFQIAFKRMRFWLMKIKMQRY